MCKLCKEERLTRWYYADDDCWVAEDLDNKGYKKRYLGVYRKHSGHCPIAIIAKILNQILIAARAEGNEHGLFDGQVSIGNHWHIQYCVR